MLDGLIKELVATETLEGAALDTVLLPVTEAVSALASSAPARDDVRDRLRALGTPR